MQLTNYQRLIALAEKTFNLKNDSSQLHIGYNEIKTLRSIHVHTVNEYTINNEPVAWLTIIPSNEELMRLFLDDKLNEKELYNYSIKLSDFNTLYLCSALVLEEYQKKGIISNMAVAAIQSLKTSYSIKALFAWPFTEAGKKAALSIANKVSLPLFLKHYAVNKY